MRGEYGMTQIKVSVSELDLARLKAEAKERDRSLSYIVYEHIKRSFELQDKEQKNK